MAYTPTAGVFVNGQVIDAIDFNTEFALVSVGMAEDVTLLNQAIIDAINDLIANGADDFVMLVGAQSIPGAKTFNGGLEMSSTAPDLKITNTVANDATGSRVSLLESTGNDGGVVQYDGSANEIKIIGLNAGVETDHVVIDRVTGNVQFNGVITGPVTFDNSPATTASQGATTGSLTRRDYVDGLDGANVKLTGNQTIAGIKTFNDAVDFETNPSLRTHATNHGYIPYYTDVAAPTTRTAFVGYGTSGLAQFDIVNEKGGVVAISKPTSRDLQQADTNALTRKDYVDGLDAVNVKTTGNQSIAGAKDFTSPITVKTTSSHMAFINTTSSKQWHTEVAGTDYNIVESGVVNHVNFSPGVTTFTYPVRSQAAQDTNAGALTRKDYVDGLSGGKVTLATAQNISGAKVFDSEVGTTAGIALDLDDYLRFNRSNSGLGWSLREPSNGYMEFATRTGTGAWARKFHLDTNGRPYTDVSQGSLVNSLTRKDYVDTNFVDLTTTQTIGGSKTFTFPVSFNDLPRINTHTTDHGYLQYFTQQSSPGTRTAFVGYGGAGSTVFDIRNELGGVVAISKPFSADVQQADVAALTRKDYVDGLDATSVKTTGDQVISGNKTFSGIIDSTRDSQQLNGTRLSSVDIGTDGNGWSISENAWSFHTVETNCTNIPPTVNNGNALLSLAGHSGGYGMQLFASSDRKMYHRNAFANGFNAWEKVITENEHATSTTGGTVRMRVSGTDLFITNNGSNA